jgi:hypothetical protein
VKLISPNKERLNPTSTHAETAEPFFTGKEKSRELLQSSQEKLSATFSFDCEILESDSLDRADSC